MSVAVSPADAAATPQVRLLGTPAFLQGGKTIPLEADRAHSLLALLGSRREWVRRDELADLLYPGRDLESARSNLRKVVFLARKVEGIGEIEQRGDLLRWAPDSDLARFEAACDERRYQDAVALYGGTLLLGLDPGWPPAAREWLDAERQRLQSRWHEACTRRLAELAGEPEALRALAETMLRHDPLDDVALQALARAQQALGRAEEALATIAAYSGRLTSELQIDAPAAVRQLADDLRGGRPTRPAQPDRLIGRRHELAVVRERLADPACRVLTLLGPPGVGKSALARSVATEHQGAWVALEPVGSVEEVPAALAVALGLVPDARLAPWQGLAQALGARQALLVMDNVETLPIAAPLAALLKDCPGLRVVATSRAPLGLDGEWRQPLDGLPLPDLDERDPEVLLANDAVALFERRVRPLVPGFNLAAEAGDVVQLVHDVEGLPLAIELLAAWRRLMPVSSILQELAASLDVLEPSGPGERSIRAAFEKSWQQLGSGEQRTLARLALLPSPCEREAARRAVQAPLPVLAALVDRSLLRVDEAGRFCLHPLIRRCAQPYADDVEAVRERHARHAAETLSRPGAPLAELLPHALAAWDWAVEQADAPVLRALAGPLSSYLCRAGRASDGLPRTATALSALRHRLVAEGGGPAQPETKSRETREALAHVLVARSLCSYAVGELDASLASADEAYSLASKDALDKVAAEALRGQGAVHWQRGQYEAAEEAFRRRLLMVQALGLKKEERSTLGFLALVAKSRGRYEEALARYSTSLQALRADGKEGENLYLFNNMGNLLRLLGRTDEALALLREGLKISRDRGMANDETFLLTNVALAHETRGELAEAAHWAEQARDMARTHGEPMIEAAARLACARVAARRERDRRGLADVHASLAIAERLNSMPVRVQCLATAGFVLAAAGDVRFGLGLVHWAMAHPDFTRSEREDAARHLAALDLATAPHDVQPAERSVEDLIALLPLA